MGDGADLQEEDEENGDEEKKEETPTPASDEEMSECDNDDAMMCESIRMTRRMARW